MNLNAATITRKFTLVEMLVVITIIAILASLLMPCLQNALSSSEQLKCMNNLRGIGASLVQYSDENGGFLPATYSGYGTDPLNGAWTEFSWQRSIWPYLRGPLQNNPYNAYSSVMKSTPLYCSSPIVSLTGAASYTPTSLSRYGMNHGINHMATGKDSMAIPCRMSLVGRPSMTTSIVEVYSSQIGNGYNYLNPSVGCGNIPHNERSNFLFVDNHVMALASPQVPAVEYSAPYNVFWFGGR